MTFQQELQQLLNKHSRENESGTPDFILAAFLQSCLVNYEATLQLREKWHGRQVNTIGGTNGNSNDV